MAITYPLTLPTATGIMSVELMMINVAPMSQSPLTLRQQIHSHDGQAWSAIITLPPLVTRANAQLWTSFLAALKGRTGKFLMGNPAAAAPLGSASSAPGTPVVNGVGQVGEAISIDGCPNSATGYLLAGDFIQFGSGSTATLHKVLEDVDTNGSGGAVVEIWPSVRNALTDNSTVVVTSAVGRWRLNTNEQGWSVNNAMVHGVVFPAIEVVT